MASAVLRLLRGGETRERFMRNGLASIHRFSHRARTEDYLWYFLWRCVRRQRSLGNRPHAFRR